MKKYDTNFELDVKNIKIANTPEAEVSHTIEELLSLNDMIPAHTDKEIMHITEKQVEKDEYMNKPSRGEVEKVTELQFKDRTDTSSDVLEVKLQKTPKTDGGHEDVEKTNAKNPPIQPIWLQVYKQEKDRKTSVMDKKLKK